MSETDPQPGPADPPEGSPSGGVDPTGGEPTDGGEPTGGEPTGGPSPAGGPRPAALVATVAVAALEAVAIAAYAVAIAVSGWRNPGSIAAPPAEVVLYLVFAAGLAVLARGLARRRQVARTPFGVAQLFGLVVGWTLTQGDGDAVHRVGYAVLAVSVVGIALVISPAVGEALDA